MHGLAGDSRSSPRDPLVTIGAHTVNHLMLAKLPKKAVRSEMDLSRSVIEAALGVRPAASVLSVGDATSAGPREFAIAAELGFKTAVTTRPGVLFPLARGHLTALPRISVNGEYQQMRYVRVLLSGAATAMWNGFRRVEARRSVGFRPLSGRATSSDSGIAGRHPAEPGDNVVGDREDGVVAYRGRLRERHRQQRPYHDQDRKARWRR